MIAQHEGLEEPGRVGEVPLGRRGVGERLDGRVGVAERRGEIERQLAGSEETLTQRLEGRRRILPGHARAPAMKEVSGKGQSSLNGPQSALCARLARLPQYVAALGRGDVARSDEQVVGQAVEVSQQLRV